MSESDFCLCLSRYFQVPITPDTQLWKDIGLNGEEIGNFLVYLSAHTPYGLHDDIDWPRHIPSELQTMFPWLMPKQRKAELEQILTPFSARDLWLRMEAPPQR